MMYKSKRYITFLGFLKGGQMKLVRSFLATNLIFSLVFVSFLIYNSSRYFSPKF